MGTHTLVILRHAKATSPDLGAADFERPLTDRGHADAAAAGRWLREHSYLPDAVLCSPAKRTRQTWREAAATLASAASATFPRRLYSATESDLFALVAELDEQVATALLVGHNPAVSLLSALLDPDSTSGDGLRTCGIAVHDLPHDWAQIRPGVAQRVAAHTARA